MLEYVNSATWWSETPTVIDMDTFTACEIFIKFLDCAPCFGVTAKRG